MNKPALKLEIKEQTGPCQVTSQTLLLSLCKASAEQLRLDILRVLSNDSYGVLELCRIFETKQSALSHHLKILLNAGLVCTRREGNSIFYRRSHPVVADQFGHLKQALYQSIEQFPLDQSYFKRVEDVQRERATNSQIFFSENAEMFTQHQEQVAAYDLYGPNALNFIKGCFVEQPKRVMEVGPGEGEFLAELAKFAPKVFALDNSRQMLQKSQQFIMNLSLNNVSFIHGDTRHSRLKTLALDCVVLNMVLHHNASPSRILEDLSLSLNDQGQLFVTELCHHNQPWVKEACGDLWLGFDPDDLTIWAEKAGFKCGESVFLAQRNGFCVQIRQFIKFNSRL